MSNKLLKWSEEFRPPCIDKCILPEAIKEEARNIIKNGADIPDLLFVGPSGTGKTTLGKAIINELDADVLFYNGSNGSLNMEALREDLEHFGSTSVLNMRAKQSKTNLKFVFIDEADGLHHLIQPALRAAMEEYHNIRFILTANYPDKILPSIHSRCSSINFNFSKQDRNDLVVKFAHRCVGILDTKRIEYDIDALKAVIVKFYPDNRQILNTLHRYSNRYGKIDSGIVDQLNVQYDELFSAIFDMDIMGVRQWVADNANHNTYNLLWRESQNRIPVDLMPSWILALGRGQKDAGSSPSMELSVCCALTEFMSEVPKGYKYEQS